MDWGAAHRQPFTWLIVGLVASWPTPNYRHYILDSGRNPDAVHFPRLGAEQTGSGRSISDGLDYRNLLTVNRTHIVGCARPDDHGPATIRCRTDDAQRPRMFIAIFDGEHSHIGAYSPGHKRLRRGTLDNTAAQHHRYYVLGRSFARISQDAASHLLLFEIRYWNRALNGEQLDEQYSQLSSVWQFDKYRGL
jgi:hypothetical protein